MAEVHITRVVEDASGGEMFADPLDARPQHRPAEGELAGLLLTDDRVAFIYCQQRIGGLQIDGAVIYDPADPRRARVIRRGRPV